VVFLAGFLDACSDGGLELVIRSALPKNAHALLFRMSDHRDGESVFVEVSWGNHYAVQNLGAMNLAWRSVSANGNMLANAGWACFADSYGSAIYFGIDVGIFNAARFEN
jgi:hypothetical protein